eukprot:9429575-Ditylum_brightwellii.AAC.1
MIKELRNFKLIDITIDTSNSTTKSTIAGDTPGKEAHKDDNKKKNTSDDDTNPTVSLSHSWIDPTKDAQSESKSKREDEVKQTIQNKKKSGTFTKAALM